MPVHPTRRDVLAGVADAGALAAGASEAASAQAGGGNGGGWHNYRGSPARTASASRSGAFPEPVRQWDVTGLDDTVNTPRTPAVADGRLFVTTEFGDYLYAVDAAGDLLWRTLVPGDDNHPPAVLDDRVFVQTGTTLRTLGAEEGDVLWEHDLVGDERPGTPYTPPPTVHDGGVYALTDSRGLLALASDGTERWRYAPDEDGERLETAVPPAFGNDVAVLALTSGVAVAVDLGDGSRRWVVDAVEDRAESDVWVLVPPVVVDGAAVLSTGQRLVALGLDDGSERWTYDLANTIETPLAAADGRLFVAETRSRFGASDESTLTALDAASGDVDWRRTLADESYAVEAPTVAGGDVLTLVEDALHALDAATGETRWRHATRNPWRPGEPAGGEGVAVVGDRAVVKTETGLYVLGPDDSGVENVTSLLAGVAGGGLVAFALASLATGTSPSTNDGGGRR
jgi:outer membrane protein assembly factor BamB